MELMKSRCNLRVNVYDMFDRRKETNHTPIIAPLHPTETKTKPFTNNQSMCEREGKFIWVCGVYIKMGNYL